MWGAAVACRSRAQASAATSAAKRRQVSLSNQVSAETLRFQWFSNEIAVRMCWIAIIDRVTRASTVRHSHDILARSKVAAHVLG